MEESKSLAQWRFEIRSIGKKHWSAFYQAYLGAPISNFPRFYKALNMYGDWPVFEAIVASANQELTGDPLFYVLKVAHLKWKDTQVESEESETYSKQIDKAIQASKKKNEELEKKLRKKKVGK
jgi:hypothetical protein